MTKAIFLLRGAAFVAGIGLFLAGIFAGSDSMTFVLCAVGLGLVLLSKPNLSRFKQVGQQPVAPTGQDLLDPANTFGYYNPVSPNYVGGASDSSNPMHPLSMSNPANPNSPFYHGRHHRD